MSTPDPLSLIRGIDAGTAFNGWCAIEVVAAGDGRAEIAVAWREDLGQGAVAQGEEKLVATGGTLPTPVTPA